MQRTLSITAILGLIVFGAGATRMLGDFNNDGKLSIADAIAFIRVLMKADPAGDVGQEYVLASECPGEPGGETQTETIQGIIIVSIPGGSFQMGGTMYSEEQPVHSVTVSAFQMSAKEITNAQYAAYLNTALASGEITATTSCVTGAKGDYNDGKEYIYLSGSLIRTTSAGSVTTGRVSA